MTANRKIVPLYGVQWLTLPSEKPEDTDKKIIFRLITTRSSMTPAQILRIAHRTGVLTLRQFRDLTGYAPGVQTRWKTWPRPVAIVLACWILDKLPDERRTIWNPTERIAAAVLNPRRLDPQEDIDELGVWL